MSPEPAKPREGDSPRSGSAAHGETGKPTPAARAHWKCDLCGNPMRESHCKLICDQCGYIRDCSDP